MNVKRGLCILNVKRGFTCFHEVGICFSGHEDAI